MKSHVRTLQIAFTYIGTIVGAGFATGQEILRFFTRYGHWALLTILFSAALFIWLGTKMMIIARKISADSYEDFNRHLFGAKAGTIISLFTMIILIGVNSIMLAGAGAIFKEHLSLPIRRAASDDPRILLAAEARHFRNSADQQPGGAPDAYFVANPCL